MLRHQDVKAAGSQVSGCGQAAVTDSDIDDAMCAVQDSPVSRCPVANYGAAMNGIRAKAIVMAFWLATTAPAGADVEAMPAADGRIRLMLDGQIETPQSYARQTSANTICEIATWEGSDMFGQIAHCEVIGDRYWRRSMVTIDLLFDEFPFLHDFLLAPAVPVRDIISAVGAMTLYGFDVDVPLDQGSQCNGFVKGFDSTGNGFREMLIGYACTDHDALGEERADAIMRGLSVEGSFSRLLP